MRGERKGKYASGRCFWRSEARRGGRSGRGEKVFGIGFRGRLKWIFEMICEYDWIR